MKTEHIHSNGLTTEIIKENGKIVKLKAFRESVTDFEQRRAILEHAERVSRHFESVGS